MTLSKVHHQTVVNFQILLAILQSYVTYEYRGSEQEV